MILVRTVFNVVVAMDCRYRYAADTAVSGLAIHVHGSLSAPVCKCDAGWG